MSTPKSALEAPFLNIFRSKTLAGRVASWIPVGLGVLYIVSYPYMNVFGSIYISSSDVPYDKSKSPEENKFPWYKAFYPF